MNVIRSLRLASIASLLVLLFTTVAQAQTVTVTGTVKDTTGEPVIGANVAVVGVPGKGATADLDGNFTITAVPSDATLRISFVGMKTQEITLKNGGGQNNPLHLNIVLVEDSELLDEVVVVGYGTQKKVNLTGSVSALDGKTLEARPVANVAQALQGAVPGLNLGTTNAGGELNGGMSLNIRGAGTIGDGSSSSPLVLIDGTEGNLYALSPNDIESISVLKDASSSAIYGSRAAFGVILVTTKSGKEGKARVSYNGNVRFSTATQVPQQMDSYTFAQYWNDASSNSGQGPAFNDEMLRLIKGYQDGTLTGEEAWGTRWNGYAANEPWSMYTGSWCNTNWFAEMYRTNVPSQEHNVSLTGGSKSVNYYLSGSLLDQNGLIRHGRDTFKRYNLNGRVSVDVYSWLNLTYSTKWSRSDYSRPSYMTGLFFHNIARRWPTNPVYDPHGHLVPYNEIIQMETGGLHKETKDALYQQLVAEIKPLDGWIIRLEGNYNTETGFTHWDKLPVYYYDMDNRPTLSKWNQDADDRGKSAVSESGWKRDYFNGRFYTEYNFTVGKSEMKVLGGLDMELSKNRDLGIDTQNLISPDVPTINTSSYDKPGVWGGYNHWATMGFFGRVNYAYDSRYLAEISIRRDGSSRFIGDKTWATFPSFSLGWNIANEAFFAEAQKYVGQLKLRGSWGALGNTNTKALYPWFQSMPTGVANSAWLVQGNRMNTSNAPGLVSGALTWERIQNWNVGLDFAVLDNRLQGSFDYFVRDTKDMVAPAPEQPSILGAQMPKINNADMRSQGWELELRWRDHFKDGNYGLRFVLSDDKQTITRFNNPTKSLNTWYAGRVNGDIWGYEVKGLAQTQEEMDKHLADNRPSWGGNWGAGDVMYINKVDPVDENGTIIESERGRINNGKNTADDHGDLSIIGNSMPHFRFGLNADVAWKGIDFRIFLQGVGKRDWWDGSVYSIGANTGMWQSVAFTEHLDYWRPEGSTLGANPGGYYPRPLFGDGWKNFQTNTRYLQDASYMRIKNIQLGYTLPESISSKLSMSRARVYVSADNLVTFTKMTKIYDPEGLGGDWGPGKLYPLMRTVSVGLNLNF